MRYLQTPIDIPQAQGKKIARAIRSEKYSEEHRFLLLEPTRNNIPVIFGSGVLYLAQYTLQR
jgi:hypothetical protein